MKKSYPSPRSGAAAERRYPANEVRGGGREELPHTRGQGQQPRVPGCDGTGMTEKGYPSPRSGAAAGRSYPMPEAGGGLEDQPQA